MAGSVQYKIGMKWDRYGASLPLLLLKQDQEISSEPVLHGTQLEPYSFLSYISHHDPCPAQGPSSLKVPAAST